MAKAKYPKRKVRELNTCNQFCGAGGCEIGIRKSIVEDLGKVFKGVAINHWSRAVETMRANFPEINTLSCKIEEALPNELVPEGVDLHLLWSSPSCVHFANARGGRPKSNQERALAEYVTSWAMLKHPWFIIVENVPEFTGWCRLDNNGQPVKEEKGKTFKAWVGILESLGYNVEYRILNCADYGDATTRKRFFLIGVRTDIGVPVWPEPTHGDHKSGLPQWRAARECLDFGDVGKSIFGRKVPLSRKTLARLAAGAQKYWGIDLTTDALVKLSGKTRRLKPFIVKLRNHGTCDSVDSPLATVTAGGNHHALVTPLLCDHQNHGKAEPPDRPMRTVSTHDHFSLATLVLGQHSGAKCKPDAAPMPTVCTVSRIRRFDPLIVDNANGGIVRSGDQPLNTVTSKDNHMLYLPVLEDGRRLDIMMRMLKPRELARSHSFPDDFVLTGTKTEQIKQVGNSVPACTARALVTTLLKEYIK